MKSSSLGNSGGWGGWWGWEGGISPIGPGGTATVPGGATGPGGAPAGPGGGAVTSVMTKTQKKHWLNKHVYIKTLQNYIMKRIDFEWFGLNNKG